MSEELPSIVEFSEDISEAEAPPPLPISDYEADIRSAVQKISTTSGNRYAEIGFHIDVDQFPADYDVENAPDGKLIMYRRLTLTDDRAGRYRVRMFCETIGAEPPSTKLDLAGWVGLRAKVSVDHSEYEGVTREEIAKVSAID